MLIWYNTALTSLAGLDNINPESMSSISIMGNSKLTTCEIQSICDYLAMPNSNSYIIGNMTGCNSVEEVEYACSVIIFESTEIPIFTIYPNPATREFYILNKNNETISDINIFNQLGQNVLHKHVRLNSVNVSELDQGIYIIEIKSMGRTTRQKLIIE